MITRKRVGIGLGTVILALGGFALYHFRGNPFDPLDRGKEPVANEYVGQSKASIIQRYGSPSKEREGYYGLPDDRYIAQHSPSITLRYERLTGTFLISFEKKDDDWICYSSHWLPNGCVID